MEEKKNEENKNKIRIIRKWSRKEKSRRCGEVSGKGTW